MKPRVLLVKIRILPNPKMGISCPSLFIKIRVIISEDLPCAQSMMFYLNFGLQGQSSRNVHAAGPRPTNATQADVEVLKFRQGACPPPLLRNFTTGHHCHAVSGWQAADNI